jgi:hypothetical protein
MTPQEKTCFKCGEVKPISEFYKHPEMRDGHLNKCKACTRHDTQENRKKKIIYYKMYDRKRSMLPHRVEARKKYSKTELFKESHKKALKINRELYKDKIRARAVLRWALLTMKISKKPCEICGCEEKIQAHHEDYSKPLDVIWLCPKHHAWIHK